MIGTPAEPSGRGRWQRASWLAYLLGAVYLVCALLMMWRAPRVPYADGWRFLGHFASVGFPRDILTPDNGHFEVLPNIVRVAELQLLDADQSLQVLVGMLLLLSCLVVGWRTIATAQASAVRAAALLLLVIGFCWLGNARSLAHANESVHAYAVTLFLFLGMSCLTRRAVPARVRDTLLASVCGLLAAVSFGSGIAVFVAFLVIAVAKREPLRNVAILLAAAAGSYSLLRTAGAGATPDLDPLGQGELALRWLASPWLHVAAPAWDPAVAGAMPPPLAAGLMPTARRWEAAMGPVALSIWPHVGIGASGVAVLLAMTWVAIRGGLSSRLLLLGLGLAWFGLSVGAMVAIVRAPYFEAHPDQLIAPRYLVWSTLFWAGLGMLLCARARTHGGALAIAIAAAVLVLPSQYWTSRLAGDIRVVAAHTATAVAVGVLEPDLLIGETVARELAVALPPLKRSGTSVFAWRETKLLGQPAPVGTRYLDVGGIVVAPVDNLLGPPGRRVSFEWNGSRSERLLLVDEDNVIRGLATYDAMRGGYQWTGWMTMHAPARDVRVGKLPESE